MDERDRGDVASDPAAAWADFCDRLKATGQRILGEEFPQGERARAEGFRHLARLAVFGLQWSLEFSDPEFPALYRYDDDVVKWGGPNTDNHYYRAKVEASGTYRVSGNVKGLRELIISTPEGDMQLGKARVFEERNLSQLHVGPDGWLEVIVSAAEHPGNWIPLHPEADHLCLRQYVSDWERDPVASLRVERVGSEGRAPAPLTPSRAAAGLTRAAEWVEASVVFWNNYLRMFRGMLPDNELSPPRGQPGGAGDVLYGGGYYDLGEGQALLIESEPPDARYYSIQLYTPGWFESLDFANRLTSYTGHQLHLDEDGRFRVVIAHQDPGTPNWLDTEGRPDCLITYRWVFSRTAPTPTAKVVPLAELRAHLPASTPRVTAEERRGQIARRQAAVARRFRV